MSIGSDLSSIPVKPYDQLRPQIRSGDILLCSGSSFFSTLIQKATNSIWSHVGFILRLDVINRVMVLESVESVGVRDVPLSFYVANYNGGGKPYPGQALIARHEQMKSDEVPCLSEFAVDLLGYPYDKEEILRIAARLSTKALGLNLPSKPLPHDRAYICSEYAFACYQSVGITIDYDASGFVTPSDFAKTPQVQALNFIQLNNTLNIQTQFVSHDDEKTEATVF